MDLRIRKTKKQLRESLVTLAGEKQLNRIAVTELSRHAGINKATFYLHYSNIYDLVHEIEDEMIDEFVRKLGKVDSFFRNFPLFLDVMKETYYENRPFMFILYINNMTLELQDRIISVLIEKIKEENPHIDFNEDLRPILMLCLRGVLDIRLYDEFRDYERLKKNLTQFIEFQAEYYRAVTRRSAEYMEIS